MNKLLQSLALLMVGFPIVQAQNGPVSEVWVADQGDGTYKNPIIHADYSDPDVCRVGDDYYMTASSFNCVPGLPILYSKDLVNWELIGHALPIQYPEVHFSDPQHGNGVWLLLSGFMMVNSTYIMVILISVFICLKRKIHTDHGVSLIW